MGSEEEGGENGTPATEQSSVDSTMKKRIHAFIGKHGYSVKAYWLSVFIFPPAAIFIAWKKPGWTILHRVLGTLVPMVVIISGPLIVAVLLVLFYQLV